MDVPAPFSGGRDSQAFWPISVCLGLTPFFSFWGWAVGGGRGGGGNVISDTCQDGLSLRIFVVCLGPKGGGGAEYRVFVVALGIGWCRDIDASAVR